MKTDKKKLVKRNLLVPLAMNRKAGSHTKPYKSMRGKENRDIMGLFIRRPESARVTEVGLLDTGETTMVPAVVNI